MLDEHRGICTNPGCDRTESVEPDMRDGFCPASVACEVCGTQTMQSAFVLGGLL